MIFGIQYERYPNPPAQEWRRDLTKIREMGFDFIRTWLYWRKVNPVEGEWDFSHYDRLLGIAHECGLKVQIQLFAERRRSF
jgi:beta-galactosidase GanA